jgi:hypothetical protein
MDRMTSKAESERTAVDCDEGEIAVMVGMEHSAYKEMVDPLRYAI